MKRRCIEMGHAANNTAVNQSNNTRPHTLCW